MAKKGNTNLFHFFPSHCSVVKVGFGFMLVLQNCSCYELNEKSLCIYQRPSRGNPGDKRGHGAGFVNFVR